MRLRPKYTRAKEEGRHIQRSGSLISTFFMRCRSQRLVLAVSGDDLFHQFHVLNTLLGSCQCQNLGISGRGSRTVRLRSMVIGDREHNVYPGSGPLDGGNTLLPA